MNIDSIFGQARPILKLAGSALIIIATLKLFGVVLGVPGGPSEEALVGLGLLHV